MTHHNPIFSLISFGLQTNHILKKDFDFIPKGGFNTFCKLKRQQNI